MAVSPKNSLSDRPKKITHFIPDPLGSPCHKLETRCFASSLWQVYILIIYPINQKKIIKITVQTSTANSNKGQHFHFSLILGSF